MGVFGPTKPFKVIRKEKVLLGGRYVLAVTWEADFWEGPIEPGRTGRYVRLRSTNTDLANVAPSCGYYADLKRTFGSALDSGGRCRG